MTVLSMNEIKMLPALTHRPSAHTDRRFCIAAQGREPQRFTQPRSGGFGGFVRVHQVAQFL
jgi:hypothetical protein